MPQKFKTVYYSDHPSPDPERKNIKIAFGQKDSRLYELVAPLSSEELRHLLGYPTYKSLTRNADKKSLSLSSLCLSALREKTASYVAEPGGTYLGHLFLDPIQATFKGGQAEPLHSWFPFLEGYSPGFVREIIRHFAPNTKKVLDPFSGTGTTPLTAAGLGLNALFCELNPLLQLLTAVKTAALLLDQNRRLKIAEKFRALIPGLPDSLLNSSPDYGLRVSYR